MLQFIRRRTVVVMSNHLTVCAGEHNGSLVFVPLSYVKESLTRLSLMVELRREKSWETLLEKHGVETVRSVFSSAIESAWYDIDEDSEEDVPDNFWPDVEAILDSEAWQYSISMLDDSEAIGLVLPDEVMHLAVFPATSVMTEHDPCRWSIEDRSKVTQILETAGFVVVDGSGYFADYLNLFRQV